MPKREVVGEFVDLILLFAWGLVLRGIASIGRVRRT
jgi:hypothetical protein